MGATALRRSKTLDGSSEELSGQAGILVEGSRIAGMGRPVTRDGSAGVPGAKAVRLHGYREAREAQGLARQGGIDGTTALFA